MPSDALELKFEPGETVKLSGPNRGARGDINAVYVVMKHSSHTVSIAKLGGDNGRYLRVPPNAIKHVKIKMRG